MVLASFCLSQQKQLLPQLFIWEGQQLAVCLTQQNMSLSKCHLKNVGFDSKAQDQVFLFPNYP